MREWNNYWPVEAEFERRRRGESERKAFAASLEAGEDVDHAHVWGVGVILRV
jgi:hypothetical protein